MGSTFFVYFQLGMTHIADWQAYDHILFITALTSGYGPRDWRRLLWLVTAFTLGHTITLALATLGWVSVPGKLVEVLIPVTIVATAAYTLRTVRRRGPHHESSAGRSHPDSTPGLVLYTMAAAFGLIHGLGFSTFLRSVLGAEERIALPLFAFNVGLEVGQAAIVGTLLLAGAFIVDGLRIPRRFWMRALSSVALVFGLIMIVQRLRLS